MIAFPTDTVYGVGARALDPSAVRRLYAIKRRPLGQPVILLVSDAGQVRRWATSSPQAEALMERFWPGALTLVLARRPGSPIIGAAGPTVAFRAPAHPVALELLKSLGEPIASSSANPAGGPPPTDADGALAALGNAVDLVLDGGAVSLGAASTILDLSGERPRVLRQGAIPARELLGPS